jgi:hypothetical protein
MAGQIEKAMVMQDFAQLIDEARALFRTGFETGNVDKGQLGSKRMNGHDVLL